MAKKTSLGEAGHQAKPKKKRPGVHSKKTTSNLKSSKNWKKRYRGQGK